MNRAHRIALCGALLLAGCGGGGGGGATGPTLLPPLDQTYTSTGAAARGDVFVHLFEWRWADIAKECEDFLGPNGYAGVQISPPSEHAVITGFPWWQRYQTVSYSLASSRSGSLADFRAMVSRCKTAGVAIYADVVINHMTAGAGTGSAGSVYSKYSYPAVPWTGDQFHTGCSVGNNYGDPAAVQLCELSGLADLRTEDEAVRDRIAQYLIALHTEGVAGFRIDAAKHMQPRDIDAILAKVNAAALAAQPARPLPYVFLEVINNPGEAVTAQQYFGVGHGSGGASDVTDFIYGYRLSDAFLGRNNATLASLQTLTTDLLPSDKGVVFVDNHDNQRSSNLYYADGAAYELATIFMLAFPQGAPSVMSSYGFNRSTQPGRDAGPPSDGSGATTSTFDGNGNSLCTKQLGTAQVGSWICEHRRDAIAAMPAFRKATAGTPLVGFRVLGDNNRIAFERQATGYVAINKAASAVIFVAQTSLPSGNYCNVAVDRYDATARSCTGTPIGVASGTINLNVPANSAVVLHVGATTN